LICSRESELKSKLEYKNYVWSQKLHILVLDWFGICNWIITSQCHFWLDSLASSWTYVWWLVHYNSKHWLSFKLELVLEAKSLLKKNPETHRNQFKFLELLLALQKWIQTSTSCFLRAKRWSSLFFFYNQFICFH
jgi:hypothetical protein